MPYPCCCRQANNGDFCVACGTTTPSQWALTWPEFVIEKLVAGVYSDVLRVPTGTHILTQTPGTAGCCWNGAAFTICTSNQNVTYIARPYAWVTTQGAEFYLQADFLLWQPATTSPTTICGNQGGNNRTGRVSWSKTELAGCRSGPYTDAVTGTNRILAFNQCQLTAYVTQSAGNAILEDVSA